MIQCRALRVWGDVSAAAVEAGVALANWGTALATQTGWEG